jgi:hypothetical protein
MLCDPTEHEERALCSVPVEFVQKVVDAPRQPARTRRPFLARDGGFESFHLKVFLDIDRKKVRRI